MNYPTGSVAKPVSSIPWQDYRAANTGMVVIYSIDPVSEIPIREVPEELASDVPLDPHYETGTYGLYACTRIKIRSAFVKSKIRYLFFAAKYEGRKEELRDKYILTGYYRVCKTADVAKLHLRYLTDSMCMSSDSCMAMRADEVQFVALDDVMVLTKEILEAWGQKSAVTRQTRILLNEEQTKQLLDYLKSKPNALATYIEETNRLQPAGAIEEEENEPEEDAGESSASSQNVARNDADQTDAGQDGPSENPPTPDENPPAQEQ